ncbi:MAG: hypothetical protein RLZZ162_2306 [Verrucomicrobiota bacterium]
MFPSVCSIRSAQCAALIALAAVVGLSRFEPTSQPEPDTAGTSSGTRSVPRHPSFSRAFGLLAHAIGFYREVFVRPTFISSPLADEPTAGALVRPPLGCSSAEPIVSVRRADFLLDAFAFSHPQDRESTAVRQHRFPFAVGPPSPHVTPPHRAAGTSVPKDVTARWPMYTPVVPLSVSPVARVACCQLVGQRLAALKFLPSFALRGEPAPFPTSVRFRLSLGASGLSDACLFSFST